MTRLLTNDVNNNIPAPLASAVAPAGTFTVSYPGANVAVGANPVAQANLPRTNAPGIKAIGRVYTKGNYVLSNNQHRLRIGQNIYVSPQDFTLTFNANASGITVTNKTASTWPVTSDASLQLNLSSNSLAPAREPTVLNDRVGIMYDVALDLGSPIAGAAANISAAQAVAAAGNLTITGALATNSIALMDVPRTLQFVSTNAGDTTQTATITGVDEYGQKVTETVTLNGTTVVTSKKAVMQVSKIAISAATVGNISAGASNIIGLPIALYKSAVQVLKEAQDGAAPTAGTFANADGATPTATTGDVRGTYLPNATPDGSKGFVIYALVPDPSDNGVQNYGV